MTDSQIKHFREIVARLGEMFDDYMIIVKPSKNNIMVHSSDNIWAAGAVQRFDDFIHTEHVGEEI